MERNVRRIVEMTRKELQNKIALSIPLLPLRVISICIYGSYARGAATKDSDIDILVIANDIAKKRIDRTDAIIKIKDAMALKTPADILLLTEDECIANFRGHNPLFLDIVLDGVVVFDTNEFIKALVEKTREYMKEKGIRRIGTLWKFPVKPRIATAMSRMSNKDWAGVWLNDAGRDAEIAVIAFKNEFYEKSAAHSQQAVEKAVKAVLLCWGGYPKSHYVGDILIEEMRNNETGDWEKQLKELAQYAKELEPHVSLSRYPRISEDDLWIPYEKYTMEMADRFLEFGKMALAIADGYLKWWFKK